MNIVFHVTLRGDRRYISFINKQEQLFFEILKRIDLELGLKMRKIFIKKDLI